MFCGFGVVLCYEVVLEVWGASMDPGCGAQTRTVDCIVLGELSRFLILKPFYLFTC